MLRFPHGIRLAFLRPVWAPFQRCLPLLAMLQSFLEDGDTEHNFLPPINPDDKGFLQPTNTEDAPVAYSNLNIDVFNPTVSASMYETTSRNQNDDGFLQPISADDADQLEHSGVHEGLQPSARYLGTKGPEEENVVLHKFVHGLLQPNGDHTVQQENNKLTAKNTTLQQKALGDLILPIRGEEKTTMGQSCDLPAARVLMGILSPGSPSQTSRLQTDELTPKLESLIHAPCNDGSFILLADSGDKNHASPRVNPKVKLKPKLSLGLIIPINGDPTKLYPQAQLTGFYFLIPLRGSNSVQWNDEDLDEDVAALKMKTKRRMMVLRLFYLMKDLLDPG